jgi:hypothetical protein
MQTTTAIIEKFWVRNDKGRKIRLEKVREVYREQELDGEGEAHYECVRTRDGIEALPLEDGRYRILTTVYSRI